MEAPPIASPPLVSEHTLQVAARDCDSIAERQSAECHRRRLQYWEDTPCWLVSLVFHLTLFVALGLLSPPDRQGNAIQLVVRPASVVSVEQQAVGARIRQLQNPGDRQGQPEDDRQDADRSTSGESAAVRDEQLWEERAAQLASKVESLQSFMQELKDLAAHARAGSGSTSPLAPQGPAALLASTGRVAEQFEESGIDSDAGGNEASDEQPYSDLYAWGDQPDIATSRSSDDEIVQRFILYDIGQLRGAAGNAARRDFYALGPSAIPALVRGLNRSGSIRASCPVGVISSKLRSAMQSNRNPALIAYALDNLGRGVKRSDPHAGLIESFRKQMLREYGSKSQGHAALRTAEALERAGLRQEARQRYRLLVSNYPDSEEAMIARRRLQTMVP